MNNKVLKIKYLVVSTSEPEKLVGEIEGTLKKYCGDGERNYHFKYDVEE